MNLIQTIFNSIEISTLIPKILNMLFLGFIVLLALTTIEMMTDKYKEDRIKGLIKDNGKVSKLRNITFFKSYANKLETVLKENQRENLFNTLFYFSIGLSAILLIGLFCVKQILLAILAPFIILWVSNKICINLLVDITESIEKELPTVIDNIIRIYSKYSDIKTILYEVSLICEQPLKNVFEEMSREMSSTPADEVMTKYAEKYDNVWFYSLTFILLSYLEDSSKEETIKNLSSLRNLLEKENTVQREKVTGKKLSVTTNYVVIAFGVGWFILDLLIIPGASTFFFSTIFGLICFIGGFACVIATIFININMSKSKEQKVTNRG